MVIFLYFGDPLPPLIITCCKPSVSYTSSFISAYTTAKHVSWKTAVKIAGWIHVDEMRTLLEIHYDEVHFQRWRSKDGKAPERKESITFSRARLMHIGSACANDYNFLRMSRKSCRLHAMKMMQPS